MQQNIQVEKIAQLTGHNSSIYTLESMENSQYFLSAAGDGWIVRWDLNAPEMGKLLAKVETQIFAMAYLEDREKVVVGNMNGGVHWVDLKEPSQTKNIAHHKKGVYGIKRVGEELFTIGGDGVLTKWAIENMRTLESVQLSYESLRSIAFSSVRNELAIGCSDNNIYFLDATTLALKHTIFQAHDNSVFALHYTPDEMQLLSGGRDAHLKVWQLNDTYDCHLSQPAHLFTLNSIVFHPHKAIFATASRDKTIKIWDAHNYKLLKVIESIRDNGHLNSVNALLWSKHENQLISASDDRSICVWKIHHS